ncbi:MAG: PEP-CTERM sorting domain-containing protein [Nitrospiraceae bacterium]
MKYVGRLASLFVLTMALGWSSPENASATYGWYDWSDLLNWFRNYYQEHHHHKSVPIPGTLLLLAGGIAGVAWLRARRSQD